MESYECINYLLEGMSFNDVLDRGGGTGEQEKPPGTRAQHDFKEKSQELRVGKFIRQLGQGSGRQWKEMREWRQAPVDLPSSLFFCCY